MEVSWIYTVCAVDEEPGPGEDTVPAQPFERAAPAWSYQRDAWLNCCHQRECPSCVAHEGVFHKVVVRQLSGESLEITLSETATIIDVKARVQVSWDVECAAQRMVLGEAVVENDETLSSLHDGSALQLTVWLMLPSCTPIFWRESITRGGTQPTKNPWCSCMRLCSKRMTWNSR